MAKLTLEKSKQVWEVFNSLPDNVLMTKKDVSLLLGVSTSCLSRWRRSGVGPRVVRMPSGAIRYPVSGVREYLEQAADLLKMPDSD